MTITTRLFRIFLCTLLSLTSLHPALAQEEGSKTAWKEFPRPPVGKGLMMHPQLLASNSRVHLVWIGTSPDVTDPEVFHTSLVGGDNEWGRVQAPFFGQNKSRVRRVAIGQSRNIVGIAFQRTLIQSQEAYEILLSLSGDNGWGWSNPIELDHFGSDKAGGTALAIEGRQGSNRPEFTIAWSRAFGNVRATNFDITSSIRPEAALVGTHGSDAMKVEVGSLGRKGFSVVYSTGVGLSSAHVKPLIGKIEEGSNFLRGRFGTFFGVASSPFGPSRIAVGIGNKIEALTSNGTGWKKDDQSAELPFTAGGVDAEVTMDDDKNLHVVMVRPNQKTFEIWYIGQNKKKWGTPEKIDTLDSKVDMRGFDIATNGDYIFVAASRGYETNFYRRSAK